MSAAKQQHPPLKNDRFLRFPELKRRVGFSRAQIYSLIQQGKFPKQIKLGARGCAWLESSIDAWIDDRVAASKTKEG
jgi:prophage regulatory protein